MPCPICKTDAYRKDRAAWGQDTGDKICNNCGHTGPLSDWNPEDDDQGIASPGPISDKKT